jgi:hypothetical protein
VETCGASSVSIQKDTIRALSRGAFPNPTSHEAKDWNWAHLRLTQRSRRAKLEVFLADIAGHAMLEEVESPGSHQAIGPLMTKSTGILLMVDAARVAADDKDEEYFARQLISHANELRELEFEALQRKREAGGRKSRRAASSAKESSPPVALVLMKSDQCSETWDDPRGFARSRMPSFWAEMKNRIANLEVFAASAVGAVAKRRTSSGYMSEMPLRVEPRGIIEPFRWLIGQSLKN